MNPFEDLLTQLSAFVGSTLKPDHNQSCLLHFNDDVSIQIDLDSSADKIIVGQSWPSFPRPLPREHL